MQNTKAKFCALLLFSVIIVGLFALSPTFSSLTNTVVINSTGRISLSSITANSGSPADIQIAVNAVVAAGGGTVHVPAGTFTFNPPVNGTGVTIPFTTVPISIIGAGVGVTILQETVNSWYSTMFGRGWSGQNYNGSAVRISGISFVGFPEPETGSNGNTGIVIVCTQDFRIDHCSFVNFVGQAIYTDDNTGRTYRLIDRGVIDHNTFDNPYKDALQPHNATGAYYSVWGYGIVVVGDYQSWDTNIADYLGYYYPTTTVTNSPSGYNGQHVPQPIYIEYNNFARMRHAISANGGGYYVSRYNYFQECAPYGQNDGHGNQGSTPTMGTRGIESYSNVFNFTDESYSDGQDATVEWRGGGGVCWNNTVILNPSYNSPTVQFKNDGEAAPYDVEQVYIWNNTAMYPNGAFVDFNSRIALDSTFHGTLNVNYFLRAPNQTLDGFNYTPYTYPMPLTLSGTP